MELVGFLVLKNNCVSFYNFFSLVLRSQRNSSEAPLRPSFPTKKVRKRLFNLTSLAQVKVKGSN